LKIILKWNLREKPNTVL